jgi:crotonobetainyl-CoA:carnitine CoA-transferase CaiB-like acyl-CoA transferase
MTTDTTLRGVRVLSLALNLPGPAALMRVAHMGAKCTKVNPPKGDPMSLYTQEGYSTLHKGVKEVVCDLKSATGQKALHRWLAKTDVLLTSFRPSALSKLGLSWKTLHKLYPHLSCVSLVGAPGPLAEIPGHDLTYQAEVNLVPGMDLPTSLFADMGGAVMASEAVLKATLVQRSSGQGSLHEVALSDAAAWLALPRTWGMTLPKGPVGGAHAGYKIYACKNVATSWCGHNILQHQTFAAGNYCRDQLLCPVFHFDTTSYCQIFYRAVFAKRLYHTSGSAALIQRHTTYCAWHHWGLYRRHI